MAEQYKRRAKTDNIPLIESGKLQPQAVELEEAVLGALMLDKNAITVVSDILKPE
ncbi:MAG: DnaB-like helicase N-terminal domain-containing protein, partial [Bacteroidota bacterium]